MVTATVPGTDLKTNTWYVISSPYNPKLYLTQVGDFFDMMPIPILPDSYQQFKITGNNEILIGTGDYVEANCKKGSLGARTFHYTAKDQYFNFIKENGYYLIKSRSSGKYVEGFCRSPKVGMREKRPLQHQYHKMQLFQFTEASIFK